MMTESDPINTIMKAITEFMTEGQNRDQQFLTTLEAKMSDSWNRWVRTTVKFTRAETTTNILNSVRDLDLCSSCQTKLAKLEKQIVAKQRR
jgi:hypothetical protein